MTVKNPVFAALDTTDLGRARELAGLVAPHVGGLKLGLEFFLAQGLENTAAIAEGMPLFLDLKLHDIPNTVAGGVKAIARLKPEFLTIHTAGGSAMMRAAVAEAGEAVGRTGHRIKLLGVTVLTSLDDGDLDAVGQRGPAADQVRRLALLARASGLDGVICSPFEVALLRAELGPDFQLVVPGIRPAGAALGDQKRVMGPRDAIAAGASRLVIGRPITEAPDPAAAARAIAADLAA
jgi:orotidine-5'-phosphate decarboxylase